MFKDGGDWSHMHMGGRAPIFINVNSCLRAFEHVNGNTLFKFNFPDKRPSFIPALRR